MEQYEIVIINDTGDTGKSNLAGQGGNKNEDNIAKSQDKVVQVLKYTALQSARQLVVSKVGQFTRDNLLQRRIDTAISIAEDAMAFAINPVYGAINLVIKTLSQAIDYDTRRQKEINTNRIMWERAGYLNRSRE